MPQNPTACRRSRAAITVALLPAAVCAAAVRHRGTRLLRFQKGKTMLDQQSVSEFHARLRGDLIQPHDTSYEEARKVYNAMIDRHPALIARCVDAADVMSAV